MTLTFHEPELRRVYGAYPTGVAVVAGLLDGRPAGIAASSFVPVSLDPPLVSVCVAHTSRRPAMVLVARRHVDLLRVCSASC
ncbi:hypothetical protein GWI34_02205 [Actinomadura sp. DSM 109109]|nr:hypothetical protein [Actinomadura lepetitiana]